MVYLKKIYLPNTEILSQRANTTKFTLLLAGPSGYTYLQAANTALNRISIKDYYLSLKTQPHINKGVWKAVFQQYNSLLTKLYYGICFSFRQYLKVKGLGYFIKYTEDEHKLCLIFGKSNYEYLQIPENISISLKPKKKKQVYKLSSTSDQILNLFSKQLQTKALPDPYRLKGIRFVRQQLVIKPGKKKK